VLLEAQLGVNHPDVAAVLTNQGLCLRELGKFKEAVPLCQRVRIRHITHPYCSLTCL
jgi:hypothetical protein